MEHDRLAIDHHVDDSGALADMASEVEAGLTATPKRLPSKYFYDDRGSRLFERITELPEYYLTRAEQRLLDDTAAKIVARAQPHDLIELGAGSAKKTRTLIEAGRAAGTLRRYLPVEVSLEMAERTAHQVAGEFPGLGVHAVVGDFERHLDEIPEGDHRLVALLGSTLGNFPHEAAVRLLRNLRELVDAEGHLLLGTDLVKERSRLEAAYNDSQGVTAEFNLNILSVINRHLGGDFRPGDFEHVSWYDEQEQRIESYLRSRQDQTVVLRELDLEVRFAAGEMLRTEVSCKYTRESLAELLDAAGLKLDSWYADEDFALSLSRLD